jgi:hypothetical protein
MAPWALQPMARWTPQLMAPWALRPLAPWALQQLPPPHRRQRQAIPACRVSTGACVRVGGAPAATAAPACVVGARHAQPAALPPLTINHPADPKSPTCAAFTPPASVLEAGLDSICSSKRWIGACSVRQACLGAEDPSMVSATVDSVCDVDQLLWTACKLDKGSSTLPGAAAPSPGGGTSAGDGASGAFGFGRHGRMLWLRASSAHASQPPSLLVPLQAVPL